VTTTPPDPRVDDLRQQLRSLGYLDAGVDRFVLAPASRARRPMTIAVLASLRIGLLGALLLGPAAAVGLGGRMPGLVTGPRDAIVVAVYLGVLFGAAVALAAFGASLAASWMTASARPDAAGLSRRARAVSVAAGAIVTIACLAYLTLWWRTANAGIGWSAPVWTIFALAVAAAISLLLGHAVTVTALTLAMARPGRDALSARVPGASWRTSLVGGGLAFAGAAALLVLTASADTAANPDAPPLTVRPTGTRVTVLAIDGFDDALHERLRPEPGGAAPSSLFTVFDSARADLAPSDSRDPARLWTTIATGVRPESHGVEQLETRRVAGVQGRLTADSTGRAIGVASDLLRLTRPAIASNVERRVKTFWEVAAQAGLRTAVVNWWTTWPASDSAGTVISDRAVLRLERGGTLDAEIAPAQLYETLKERWPELRARAQQRAASFFAAPGSGTQPPLPADAHAILLRSAELDTTMMLLAEAVGADLDLLVVYLPGLDIAQHTLLTGADVAPAPSELEGRLAALRQYYVYLDSLVSGPARPLPDRTVFVITQPGRLHQGAGVLAAAGLGARTGARSQASVLDVAPTILHTLGVPISRSLDGRVADGVFLAEFLAAHPVRHVETYGLRGPIAAAREGKPLDQEMIDRLRSLGYVR
jgi:hypothetical protein